MKKVTPPNHNVESVFNSCIATIRNDSKKAALNNFHPTIVDYENRFLKKAPLQELYKIVSNTNSKDSCIVCKITKEKFNQLYSQQFLKNQAPRKIYDEIRNSTNLCVYCFYSPVEALDHYLPLSNYPFLCITPVNLLPCCNRCNNKKSNFSPIKKENQIIHPGYEQKEIFDERWLYMSLKYKERRPIFSFYIETGNNWPDDLKKRLEFHFEKLDLAKRYLNAASEEYRNIEHLLNNNNDDIIELILKSTLTSTKKYNKNSWKTAFYDGLLKHLKNL